MGSIGYVPEDVLALRIEPPARGVDDDGHPDRVVAAVLAREEGMTAMADTALTLAAPNLAEESREVARALLLALLDGLGVRVCLGLVSPEEAVAVLHEHLLGLGSV